MTYKNNIVRLTTAVLFFFTMAATSLAQTLKAQFEEVGGYYRLSFVVNSSDASSFSLPSLPDFEQRSDVSTSTSSSYQFINGHASHSESTTFTVILSARHSGRVKIGSASVRVGNRVVKSAPITVSVQAGQSGGGASSSSHASSSASQPQQSVQSIGSSVTERDLFIDVTPSRTKVREQEAVLLTYRVHSRVGVGLANTSLTHKPDFKDIISQEIPLPGNQIETTIEHRAGGTYRTGTILQYVVFPQRSGKITIPGISFNCTVVQQDASLDLIDAFFNNGGSTIGVNVTRNVSPITLDVEALPTPKPAAFSGAVGKFSLKGNLLNPTIRTNDVATYRITLHGVGNIKLITPPVVSFPKDFDTYDAKTNDNSKVTPQGLSGDVTFDYTFVPRNVGKYTIPAVQFTYFDTEKGTYQTLETQPLTIDVAQGERSNSDVDRQLALLKSDIRAIRSEVDLHSSPSQWLTWGSALYFSFHLLLIIVFVAVCMFARKYISRLSNVTLRRRKGAAGFAEKRLKKAHALLTGAESRDFYSEVSKALRGYVSDKLDMPIAELSKEKIGEILEEKQVEESLRTKMLDVLSECELAQFTPSTDNSRQSIYDAAVELIKSIKL